MKQRVKTYDSHAIAVRFDARRCIHAAEEPDAEHRVRVTRNGPLHVRGVVGR